MDINPKILDLTLREQFGAGGATALDTGVYRGYAWSKEWFVGARSAEPMLVIWPLGRQRQAAGFWGICLSSAGKYLTTEGGATPELRPMAKRALLEVFDRPALEADIQSLMDLVVRHLPDVILMTPVPRQVREDSAGIPLLEVELSDENSGAMQAEVSI